MTRIAHRKIEQHTQQLSLVVVRNAALRKAVVGVLLEPCIEAGFLRRLRQTRRPPLESSNRVCQAIEIRFLRQQSSPQQDVILHRAGHTFAEPQSIGVILFRVVHWLERLRADTLHIPQMNEFMGGDIGQLLRIVRQYLGVQGNCG